MSTPASSGRQPVVDALAEGACRPPQKGVQGLRRLFNALGYSWSGLRAAWRHEAAFREELLLVAILAPAAFMLTPVGVERALLVGSLLLILLVELLNSAIETVVDRVSEESHPLSKIAKDIGSAAVLLALVNAATIWALVLWP